MDTPRWRPTPAGGRDNYNWSPTRVLPAEVKVMAETGTALRKGNGVVRIKLVDNPSDQPRKYYDFTTGVERTGPSAAESQRRFLAALHKDGFEPFDGDEDGTQYWRRPTTSSG